MTREKSIYVNGKTLRRMFWIYQVEKNKRTEQGQPLSMDAIAERLLNEKIEADYPNMTAMEKRMTALENQMLIELEKNK